MGNHYHLLCRMKPFREMSREELLEKAKLFYPNTWEQTDLWSDEKWEKFNHRMFDISEYVKSFQMSFSKWYNRNFKRRGRVWADRFKTTVSLKIGEDTSNDDGALDDSLDEVRIYNRILNESEIQDIYNATRL